MKLKSLLLAAAIAFCAQMPARAQVDWNISVGTGGYNQYLPPVQYVPPVQYAPPVQYVQPVRVVRQPVRYVQPQVRYVPVYQNQGNCGNNRRAHYVYGNNNGRGRGHRKHCR